MYVCFKGVGEIAGLGRIGGEKWRRRGDGQDVGGVGWGTGGNGWRGRVTVFSWYGGASGSGLDEGVRPGCALGRTGTLAKQYGERKAMAVGSELGAGDA